MKYELRYHYIMSDHVFAVPEFDHKEIVDASSRQNLRKYIEKQKDDYGHHFKKADAKSKRLFGFDYTSTAGALKVKTYKPPKVKKV